MLRPTPPPRWPGTPAPARHRVRFLRARDRRRHGAANVLRLISRRALQRVVRPKRRGISMRSAAFFGLGLGFALAVSAGPAAAQALGPAEIASCLCMRRAVDALAADMNAKKQGLG